MLAYYLFVLVASFGAIIGLGGVTAEGLTRLAVSVAGLSIVLGFFLADLGFGVRAFMRCFPLLGGLCVVVYLQFVSVPPRSAVVLETTEGPRVLKCERRWAPRFYLHDWSPVLRREEKRLEAGAGNVADR